MTAVCDELGFTASFGGCPIWGQLRDGILDGTITVIGAKPLYPPSQLTVVTCTHADGDWHWLYVYPWEYYDAGAYGLLFDGAGQLVALERYPGYYSAAWCCEGRAVWGQWEGAAPPADWTCDDGAPIAESSGSDAGGSGRR
jgi:hypothetical protein